MLKSNKNNKVAIIGGGPGGLMLGLLLQKQGIPFTIFEKGERDINGNRGGSLDIHEESGQLPIKEANLIETFKSMARFEGEDTKILGQMAHCILKMMLKVKAEDQRLIVVNFAI